MAGVLDTTFCDKVLDINIVLSDSGYFSLDFRGTRIAYAAQKAWLLHDTLRDNIQGLAAGGCFSPGIPVSSTNKTDCHDIIEILLKVALNITRPNQAKIVHSDTLYIGYVLTTGHQLVALRATFQDNQVAFPTEKYKIVHVI
jgi:hypothetical protein